MELKKQVQLIESLPSPDFILKKIVDTASSSSASAKELNEVVSKDTGFVSKLLKLANSSYYGLPKKVSKLTEAIMILGFKTCLLYTSDAADDLLCVDLGGSRIIKTKKKTTNTNSVPTSSTVLRGQSFSMYACSLVSFNFTTHHRLPPSALPLSVICPH